MSTGWPALHIGELRFLVVGDDVGGLRRHHGHQLRPGLDVLADPQRAVADHAVDRRDDAWCRRGSAPPGPATASARRSAACACASSALSTSSCLVAVASAAVSRVDGGAGGGDARGGLLRILDAAVARWWRASA